MANKKGFFKKTILSGILSLFLLGQGLAGADEIKPKFATKQILEQKVLEPTMDINFNYEVGNIRKPLIKYSKSRVCFDRKLSHLYEISDVPELTSAEKKQIEDVITDVKYGDINSYEDFINTTESFSENQKIVLLATIGYLLDIGSYDYSYINHEVFSQEIFFKGWQDYLNTGNQNPLGRCRHIASHIEQLANKIGIKTAAVSGNDDKVNHAYNISKIGDKTAIIDYGNILVMNTKNIEEVLNAYQKNRGATAFQHLFFNDNEFRYKLITEDGIDLLDFIGYNGTSEALKDFLINRDNKFGLDISLAFNKKDYLTSVGFNCFGFFMKGGQIRGDSSSPMKETNLFQIGFDKSFDIPKIVNIDFDASAIFGELYQDTKFENNNLIGVKGNLDITTDFEKGFNFSSKISGTTINLTPITNPLNLFSDFTFGAGASYKIPIKKLNIEPYAIVQFTSFPKDLGIYKFVPMLNEIRAGAICNFNISDKMNLSFEPYYQRKIWEQEFGGNIKLKDKIFVLNLGGYGTISNYDFCPDKYGFDIGLSLMLGRASLGIDYKNDITDYDGEIGNKYSLGIKANIKF